MGIRIHKVLGYGLDDVKTNKNGYIKDPRFNLKIFNGKYSEKFMDKIDAFPKWLCENKHNLETILENLKVHHIDHEMFCLKMAIKDYTEGKLKEVNLTWNTFVHDGEFGLPNVMVLRPFNFQDWFRYNDIIDWIEMKEPKNKVVNLFDEGSSCGIYPYDGGMYLKPGKEDKTGLSKDAMTPSEYNQFTGRWDPKMAPLASRDVVKHLKKDWHCSMPSTLLVFSYYLELFADPLTVYDLKPMIYTFWS